MSASAVVKHESYPSYELPHVNSISLIKAVVIVGLI